MAYYGANSYYYAQPTTLRAPPSGYAAHPASTHTLGHPFGYRPSSLLRKEEEKVEEKLREEKRAITDESARVRDDIGTYGHSLSPRRSEEDLHRRLRSANGYPGAGYPAVGYPGAYPVAGFPYGAQPYPSAVAGQSYYPAGQPIASQPIISQPIISQPIVSGTTTTSATSAVPAAAGQRTVVLSSAPAVTYPAATVFPAGAIYPGATAFPAGAIYPGATAFPAGAVYPGAAYPGASYAPYGAPIGYNGALSAPRTYAPAAGSYVVQQK